jgi:hypothetical protein
MAGGAGTLGGAAAVAVVLTRNIQDLVKVRIWHDPDLPKTSRDVR